jgi:hypothetical protein
LRVVEVLDCSRRLMLSKGVWSWSSARRCRFPARDIPLQLLVPSVLETAEPT